MSFQNKTLLSAKTIRQWAVLFFVASTTVIAGTVNWQGPAGMTIKSVHYLKTEPTAQLNTTALQETTTLSYPVPPLAGFLPLIVITTSDERGSDEDFEHVLESGYSGTPLVSPVEDHFIIGIFDSGAELDLLAGDSATALGLTGDQLTGNGLNISQNGE